MDNDNFEKDLKAMQKPAPLPLAAQEQARSTLLSARVTARWGVFLLAIPLLFFACVVIKYFLGWNWGVAGGFLDWMARMDKGSDTRWLTPVLFVVLPGVIALANLAAVMRFVYDRFRKELIVSIRLRWINLLLALLSLAVMGMVFLYGIMENAHHRAMEQYGV